MEKNDTPALESAAIHASLSGMFHAWRPRLLRGGQLTLLFGAFFIGLLIRTAFIAALIGVPVALTLVASAAETAASFELPGLYARSTQSQPDALVDRASRGELVMAVAYPGGLLGIGSAPEVPDLKTWARLLPTTRVDASDYEQAVLAQALRDRGVFVLNRNEALSRSPFEFAAAVQWAIQLFGLLVAALGIFLALLWVAIFGPGGGAAERLLDDSASLR